VEKFASLRPGHDDGCEERPYVGVGSDDEA